MSFENRLRRQISNTNILKRVVSVTSSAAPSVNLNTTDVYKLTALAVGATLSTSGTATEEQPLTVTVKDNGTARALLWDMTKFAESGVAKLPNITPAGKKMRLQFVNDADISKMVLMAIDSNGY